MRLRAPHQNVAQANTIMMTRVMPVGSDRSNSIQTPCTPSNQVANTSSPPRASHSSQIGSPKLLTPKAPGHRLAVPRSAATGVTVSEAEVEDAMRFAFARLRLVVEPGGAVAA